METMVEAANPAGEAPLVIESVTDAEMQAAVAATLAAAGVSPEELRCQAAAGRFVSERARRAWFVVSPFLASR